jgi:hypothetical protein
MGLGNFVKLCQQIENDNLLLAIQQIEFFSKARFDRVHKNLPEITNTSQ